MASNNRETMDHSVRSPCVSNCKLDENEICGGCFRTLDEVIFWSSSTNEEKQAIIDRITPLKEAKAKHKK